MSNVMLHSEAAAASTNPLSVQNKWLHRGRSVQNLNRVLKEMRDSSRRSRGSQAEHDKETSSAESSPMPNRTQSRDGSVLAAAAAPRPPPLQTDAV